IIAIMWFIDDGLVKNKKYYNHEMINTDYENVDMHLFYGSEFFNYISGEDVVWNEIISHLKTNRLSNSAEVFTIPSFGDSDEIYKALLSLPQTHWNKLLSNTDKHNLIREELFSSGDNLKRARKFLNL
ncbi:MAG: HpyAIV family type II restriction enzyme, partial [Anaeroplasmataceae bacterium]